MESGGASRTAVFVCQGRAAAHGRLAVGRFDDPIAEHLLRADELVPVAAVRAATADTERPAGNGAAERMRVEGVRAVSEVVVPRTVVIDDAVEEAVVTAGLRQVVLVGAGLDTRPWRLDSLADATVFSVDHPASQADARDRASGLVAVAGRLVFVPVDLATARLDEALAAAGHDSTAPTVWVWEGVVPYLERPDVEGTVRAMAARSAPGSMLVVNYQTPSVVATLGRWFATAIARVFRIEAVTADEPWRSLWTPDDLAHLLARHGFITQQDVDLLQVAKEIGSPTTHTRSRRNGRVAVARFGR